MRHISLAFLFLFLLHAAYAQRGTEAHLIQPGVYLGSCIVVDSASKKVIANILINAQSPLDTQQLRTNSRGSAIPQGQVVPLSDCTPEQVRFTSATPVYRVTGWELVPGERGSVPNAHAKKTKKQFWFCDGTVYVTLVKGVKLVTIEGQVIDSIDKKPRAGVDLLVYYTGNEGALTDTAIADASGKFTFRCYVPDTTTETFQNFPITVEDEQYVFLYLLAYDSMTPDTLRCAVIVRRGVRLIPAK